MKKQLLVATMMILGLGVMAQSPFHLNNPKPTTKPEISFNKPSNTRSVSSMTCGNDTVFYSYLKEETEGTSQYWIQAAETVVTEWAQTFLNTGSLTVKGISFWGGVQDAINPGQTLTATVVLYNVDATNTPTTVITTKTILLTTTLGFKTAMFTTPQTVTGNYAVAIKNTSLTDTVAIVTNNATVSTYTEGLSHVNAPGFGGWYEISTLLTPDAPEAIIAPVISYPIATNFTMTPSTTPMCLGTALTFTNTTTPTSILANRMYNYGAYGLYWNGAAGDSTYAWDMGNASPFQWSTNAAYTYPAAGSYNVTLITLSGLFTSCVDTKVLPVVVTPNAVSSFTQNTTATPLIAFTSTSTGAVTYSWDFGDGSPLNTTANPSHTFAPGTWTVTLTVTSAGGCNTSVTTQTVTVLALDIANSYIAMVNVYPNPSSTGLFTIEMGASVKTQLEVYNLVGELVYSKEFTSATTSIDLSTIGAGIYSMKINANNKNLVKQIIITK